LGGGCGGAFFAKNSPPQALSKNRSTLHGGEVPLNGDAERYKNDESFAEIPEDLLF
jgi:hypothetical protein